MSGLYEFVDVGSPASAGGLLCNGGSEVFIDVEAVGTGIESFGSNVERLGEGLPLGKGITAPPRAACGKTSGVNNPPTIMPRINEIKTADSRR